MNGMADMMLQPSPLPYVHPLSLKAKQNPTETSEKPQQTKQQNSSVSLILGSFFVQVIMRNICVIMFFAFGRKNLSASAPEIL